MGVYLNPGNRLFAEMLQSEIYVDKTELIKNTNRVLGTLQKYVCVSRPRRFGKSMAANMLTAYYGKGCNSSALFDRCKISSDPDYRTHLNHYPVIALNMQDFLDLMPDVDEALRFLQRKILRELKESYPGMIDAEEVFLSVGLSELFSRTQETFVFVIDEWDCVLRDKRYTEQDQKKYLDFVRNLLKDKPYVSLAYMTGILPVKKYGNHSALNMFTEYSMTDPGQYAEFVGFTDEEVRLLCGKYHMDYMEINAWYDGYVLPSVGHVYNPKSVVEANLAGRCSSYWTRTETYEALKIYIEMNYDGLKDSIVRMIAGEEVPVNTEKFQNDMSTFASRDDVITLLVHLGYLSYNAERGTVSVPNREIRGEFRNAVEGAHWNEVIRAIENSERLLQATWEMDGKKVADLIGRVHSENTSILAYNDENSLSCVIALAYYSAQNEYTMVREFPSGEGFADIVYIPKKHSDKPALVVELKYDKKAESAVSQIREKRYMEALSEYHGNLLLVGINYNKKTKVHECLIEKYQKR